MPSSKFAPRELAQRIGAGLLSFPVTPFTSALAFDERRYRDNLAWLSGFDVAGLFAAGGTGEFFSLTPAEVERVVRAAADEANGQTPVIAGCGYGTAIAVEMAQAAEHAGADGMLLLPPYLMVPTQEGLMAHVEAVCKATRLGVIVYNRDNAVLTEDRLAKLCDRNPNLVGFKDGVGDIELMMRIRLQDGRPSHLCRRPADGRDLRPALSGDGRHHLFLGHLQFHAGMGDQLLRRGARQRSRGDDRG